MGEFIRARSAEQKCQRLDEIKCAALRLFDTRPYHEITLTTIAEQLSWSRANLYKYVTTKEEVFLALAEDARDAYYRDLGDAFGNSPQLDPASAGNLWTQVMARHREWFRLHDLLFTIIETNVSLERLVEFKRGYYAQIDPLSDAIGTATDVPASQVEHLMNTLHYHAIGLVTSCCDMSQVQAALAELGVPYQPIDFQAEMSEFAEMCIEHAQGRRG